ncbi:ABC transporter substrate-binding protein [Microvirga massiliensis]|uniref:ABC transporter substrate-binding protein n=1 Tax=Microvirga massiliensis TaxID=1033741 RepID=UPI00062BBF56|nr:ABC transporter substrate-binding protein [Microvirga massiliensis]
MIRKLILAAIFGLCVFPATGKTLVFCSEGNPEALNPQIVSTTTGMNAARPMFNNLVEFPAGSTNIVPALAESWTISPDGLEYVFRLRRGVRFHSNSLFRPTRELNSEDVLFSLKRQWKSDHPYHHVSGARYNYFQDLGMPDLLSSVDAPDPYTVRIRLSRPDAVFLADLAMPFNVIHSAEYADVLLKAGIPEKLDENPIGTGPFSFVDFTREVSIRYRAFPAYWGPSQAVDTLVFSITPNPAVRLTKLRSGECHVMAFPNPSDVSKIASDPDLQLLQQEGLNVGYLALNALKKPFDDPRVRRAINMAIDKQAIVQAVYQGAGVPAKNPIPPTLWSYNAEIVDYPYDVDAAQMLLAEAGHADGFETDLWFMPVSRPYNPNAKRVAEMIQADLSKVGIRLHLQTLEWSQYVATLQAGEPSMALFGWTGDNGDPDNFLDTLLGCTAARPGGNNIAKWCDPEYDRLVKKAKETTARAERERLYRQAQEIFHREAPWVPIAHSVVFMAARKEVRNFRIDPLGRHIFDQVDFAP